MAVRIIYSLMLICFFANGFGQYHQNSLLLNSRLHLGSILAHSKELPNVQKTYPYGVELEIAWQLQTERIWQYTYCYPKVGFSFFYTNFDYQEILGSAFSVYPYVEPIIGAEKKWGLFMRFGIGPSYLNNVYDSISNPTNTFYSSPLSFIVALGGGAMVKLTDNLEFKFGAIFNHISNGGIKNPNKGINFPGIFAGIDYRIRPVPFTDYSKNENLDLTLRDKWWEFTGLATGKTDIKGHARYLVYGVNVGYYKTFGRLNAWNASVEFVSDGADKKEIERRDIVKSNGDYIDHHYGAFYGGYNLLLGVFRLSFQLGTYFYSPFSRGDWVFQRYGLNVLFFNRINLGTNLKVDRHIADFLDFRLGVLF